MTSSLPSNRDTRNDASSGSAARGLRDTFSNPRRRALPSCFAALLFLVSFPVVGVRAQGEPVFLRGDANQDESVDLSDGIQVLRHLFADSEAPSCLDALDADDTGAVDLTDAVFLLDYLFQRGAVIPDPFPECGPDPSSDELDCSASSCLPDGTWQRRADLLEPNSEFSVAQLDHKLYVFGGYPSSRVTVRTVQIYDAHADTWSRGSPTPIALNHSMAAQVQGKIYLIGGQTSSSGSGPFVNNVFRYDPASDEWAPRARMPTSRSSGATAVVDDRIYVAGGRPPRGRDFAVYDPAADAWERLADLPTARNHLAAAAVDGLVYVLGGRFGAGHTSEVTDIIEVYDPATESWDVRAPMPTARGGVNGLAAQGCIYVFGGEGNDGTPSGVFPQMEVYNPATDSWRSLDPLPIPVHGVTGAAYIDGWIHLPGGGTRRGGSSGSRFHQVFRVTGPCP